MKALSVKQPFASWLLDGTKLAEHRSYATKFRGRVFIHASKVEDKDFMFEWGLNPEKFKNGFILGSVEIYDDEDLGNGIHAWKVKDAEILKEPIPASGMLSFWNIPEHIEAKIKEQSK